MSNLWESVGGLKDLWGKSWKGKRKNVEAQGLRSTEGGCTDVVMASKYFPSQALYGYTWDLGVDLEKIVSNHETIKY